jgi:hypothetical protein
MGKIFIRRIELILLFISAMLVPLSNAFSQCSFDDATDVQIIAGSTAGGAICPGQSVYIKISNLTDGVSYKLSYGSITTPTKTYWDDGNFTSVTWSVGVLTQSLPYTIYAWRGGCTVSPLFESTINVGGSSASIELSSSLPNPESTCNNQNLVLTATGTSGLTYAWHTSPAIDQSTIHGTTFSPTMPASYWVTATGPCGTSVTSNVITVGFVPVVTDLSITPGTLSMCKGSGPTAYTASASNANSSSYFWELIDGGNSTISQSGVVSWDPNFIGDAQVKVTAYGCGGSTSTTHAGVSVNFIDQATLTGGAAICASSFTTLTLTSDCDSCSGYLDPDVRYFLLLNGQQVASHMGYSDINNDHPPTSYLQWNRSDPGRYTVTASGHGCTNIPMQGQALVTLKQIGRISIAGVSDVRAQWLDSDYDVCDGDHFKLVPLGTSAFSWHIRYPDGSTPDFSSFHGFPDRTGFYSVSGKENICNTTVDSNEVLVQLDSYPNAILTPNGTVKVLSSGGPQTVSIQNNVECSYEWFKDGIPIPGATNTLSISDNGSYTSRVTSALASCKSVSSTPLVFIHNKIPTVNAGGNKTIVLPTRQVALMANASDPDGTIQYNWTRTTTQQGESFSGENTTTLNVADLHLGQYGFKLTVTDDMGESNSDDVLITVNGPPNNYNYVRVSSLLTEGKTSLEDLNNLPVELKNVQTTYFDGLGRNSQSVIVEASPLKNDLVQPIEYDVFGREAKRYLPFVSQDGSGGYKQNPTSTTANFYNNGTTDRITDDNRPFSEILFEPSPLNRPVQQFGAGQNWKDNNKAISHQYLNNQASEVLLFTYDVTTGLVSKANGTAGYYIAGQLTSNKTTDEQNNEVIEYTDKEGHTVCKKVQYDTVNGVKQYASTYYLYDDFGNLVVVLPPEAVTKFSQQ